MIAESVAFSALESVAEVAVRAATAVPDWSTTPIHERAISLVARRINTDADPAIDSEDVEQEARLYLATAPQAARDLDFGYLVNRIQTNVARSLNIYNRQPLVPLDAALGIAAVEDRASSRDFTSGWLSRPEPPEYEGLAYSPSKVEYVLPAVWDEEYGKGIPNPRAPEPGMPRSTANPKTANTHLAMIADIKTAWERASLSRRERQVLFLRFGCQWGHEEIAREIGYAHESGARVACDRAIVKLADYLNGTETDPEWEPF